MFLLLFGNIHIAYNLQGSSRIRAVKTRGLQVLTLTKNHENLQLKIAHNCLFYNGIFVYLVKPSSLYFNSLDGLLFSHEQLFVRDLMSHVTENYAKQKQWKKEWRTKQ